jgi:hypothetical protein
MSMITGFLRETLVNDKSNGTNVEDCSRGTVLCSYCYDLGSLVQGNVSDVRVCYVTPFYEIRTNIGYIKGAPGQCLFIGNEPVPLCNLKEGDTLLSMHKSPVQVQSIRIWRVGASVVSLYVRPYDNYFVKGLLAGIV